MRHPVRGSARREPEQKSKWDRDTARPPIEKSLCSSYPPLIGGIHLGQITFAELVDKVHDRVFDKDVPEPAKKKPEAPKPKAKKPTSSTTSPAPVAAAPAEPRAELAAPAPSEYAKEAAPRQDVEVVEARERLDRLLKGL